MQSGNFTDKIFRLLPGDNGPHGHLVIVHRGVDQTALIDGFKLIVKPLLTGAAHPLLPPVNGKHPTDAGGAIDQQISCLKHGKCLLSKNCKDFGFITILTLFWQKCQRIYEKSKKSLFFRKDGAFFCGKYRDLAHDIHMDREKAPESENFQTFFYKWETRSRTIRAVMPQMAWPP